ncbi:respiratory nitrate reductase subunit gamma [Thermodesulfobacteriota bacterium]
MKKTIFVLMLHMLLGSPAEASWLLDIEKFLNSAHGKNTCLECHENSASREPHPDPAKVTKKLSDFFSPDQCLMCHDAVLDKLAKGSHGAETIKNPKRYEDCIPCHDPHYQPRIGEVATERARADLSAFSYEDQACIACHSTIEAKEVARFCFQCHAQAGTRIQNITAASVALIDLKAYQSLSHAVVSCLVCHPRAPGFDHANQEPGDCLQCHPPHDEKITRAAHTLVSCEACHLRGIQATRDPRSGVISWKKQRQLGRPLEIHEMVRGDKEEACRKCHAKENRIGAVAMILPAKSVLCMPCHAATFSAGDTISIVALLIFGFGLFIMFSFVLTGSLSGKKEAGYIQKFFQLIWDGLKTLLSGKIVFIIKALLLDVLLQRRLYQKSAGRWLIHSLIFLSFVFRFLWGLIALLFSLWKPEWSSIWFLLDKNNPNTAFLFDLTGIMILLGVAVAFLRGIYRQSEQFPNLPNQDRLALGLIAGIVIVGFILEGMRIAMTGWPPGSGYALAGYGISLLFSGMPRLNQIYGFIWYLHAVFAGAFIAYLPFSRLIHIIMAPLVLALNAVTEADHK